MASTVAFAGRERPRALRHRDSGLMGHRDETASERTCGPLRHLSANGDAAGSVPGDRSAVSASRAAGDSDEDAQLVRDTSMLIMSTNAIDLSRATGLRIVDVLDAIGRMGPAWLDHERLVLQKFKRGEH